MGKSRISHKMHLSSNFAQFPKSWTLDKPEMVGMDTHIWVQMSINHPYVYPNDFYKIQLDKLIQSPAKRQPASNLSEIGVA